jgi:hypothetical protein
MAFLLRLFTFIAGFWFLPFPSSIVIFHHRPSSVSIIYTGTLAQGIYAQLRLIESPQPCYSPFHCVSLHARD